MTKQELQQYKKIEREVRTLREQMEEMRLNMVAPSIPQLTGMPGAKGVSDKVFKAVSRYLEASEKYANKVDELTNELYYIEACIDHLKDPNERTLLRLRYISGIKWENICVEMGYEWAQIHRIHAAALRNILPIK